MSHDVFLSYSRKNSDKMEAVRDGLRQAGLAVWTDDNLTPGTPEWIQKISDAIEGTSYLVVLLSPSAKKSKWVNREIAYAEKFEKQIIPILVSKKEKESIPITLVDYQYANMIGADDKDEFIAKLAELIRLGPALPVDEVPETRHDSIAPPPARLDLSSLGGGWSSPRGTGLASNRVLPRRYTPDYLSRRLPGYDPDTAARDEERRKAQEKRRKEQEREDKQQRDKAAKEIEQIRADLPDPSFSAGDLRSQLRLLSATLVDPEDGYVIRYKVSFEERTRAVAALTGLLAHTAFLLLVLVALFGWLPIQDSFFGLPNILLLPVAVILWLINFSLAGIDFENDDDLSFSVLFGGSVGLVLFTGIIGGLELGILIVLLGAIGFWSLELDISVNEFTGAVVLVFGPIIIGIVKHHFYAAGLIANMPLILDIGIGTALLLVTALLVQSAIAAAVVEAEMFKHLFGESKHLHTPENEQMLLGWPIGFSGALGICLILAVGLTVGAIQAEAVAHWIEGMLPAASQELPSQVDFTIFSQNISFSWISVTQGSLAVLIAAIMIAAVSLAAGLIWLGVTELVKWVITEGYDQRLAVSEGRIILGVLAISYVLLPLAPFIDAYLW